MTNLPDDFSLKDHMDSIEKDLIISALTRSRGQVTNAAKQLGVARTTLKMKLVKFGINRYLFKGVLPDATSQPSNNEPSHSSD